MLTIFSCTTVSFIAVCTPNVPPAIPTRTGKPANRCAAYVCSRCNSSRENAALSVLLSARMTALRLPLSTKALRPSGPADAAYRNRYSPITFGSSGMA